MLKVKAKVGVKVKVKVNVKIVHARKPEKKNAFNQLPSPENDLPRGLPPSKLVSLNKSKNATKTLKIFVNHENLNKIFENH